MDNNEFVEPNNTEYTLNFSTSPKFETRANSKVSAFRTDNHCTTNKTQSKRTQSSKPTLSFALVSIVTSAGDVSGPGSTFNNNTILIVKGGIIGLFLCILILQMCEKNPMSRK